MLSSTRSASPLGFQRRGSCRRCATEQCATEQCATEQIAGVSVCSLLGTLHPVLRPGPHRRRSRSIKWQTKRHTANPKFSSSSPGPSVSVGPPECLAVLEILAILAAFWEPPLLRSAAICGGLLGRRPRRRRLGAFPPSGIAKRVRRAP